MRMGLTSLDANALCDFLTVVLLKSRLPNLICICSRSMSHFGREQFSPAPCNVSVAEREVKDMKEMIGGTTSKWSLRHSTCMRHQHELHITVSKVRKERKKKKKNERQETKSRRDMHAYEHTMSHNETTLRDAAKKSLLSMLRTVCTSVE